MAAKSEPRAASGRTPKITPALVAAHGLKPEEYARIRRLIGRAPTFTELGIFSAMWNEHCSYKSSKIHLRSLPTAAPWVIQGPGENAGVVDIGDGLAVVFKMESHNHPSYIEPYQGAATGVGGILRDVFTMGARPIACLNFLRFGDPAHPRTRHLLAGVVAGIGAYGNSFGVPTVGGSVGFHTRYDGNCLVNAMAVGLARVDQIFYAAATDVGNPIVYLGSKTGRDGIHGATMASAEFGEDAQEKRPTVQVGDPFSEKLLLEACLEIMAKDCVVAIQDMGAAGLTCSAVEMGAKGNLGVTLDLDAVPCREDAMTAYEMMLSESQERMLMVLKPEKEQEAEAVFRKWGLDFAVIGETTPTKRFVVRHRGQKMADLPIKELGDEAPVYDRPFEETPKHDVVNAADIAPPMPVGETLLMLIGSPDLCSKRWVWEQYDHIILGNTVQRPGGDAAVVRIEDGPKALALTTDVTPRYCEADPFEGGKQAVAEAWRNSDCGGRAAAGADRQSQLRQSRAPADHGSAGGMRPRHCGSVPGAGFPGRVRQCLALQRDQRPRHSAYSHHRRRRSDRRLHQVGYPCLQGAGRGHPADRRDLGWLGQSVYLREICEREDGAPPPVDLAAERRNGDFVRMLIHEGSATAAHDVSDGGLLVALAEMAIASGIGAELERVPLAAHAFWYGEDQARYVITVKLALAEKTLSRARAAGVPARQLGLTAGEALTLQGERPILIAKLRERFEGWLPAYMGNAGA